MPRLDPSLEHQFLPECLLGLCLQTQFLCSFWRLHFAQKSQILSKWGILVYGIIQFGVLRVFRHQNQSWIFIHISILRRLCQGGVQLVLFDPGTSSANPISRVLPGMTGHGFSGASSTISRARQPTFSQVSFCMGLWLTMYGIVLCWSNFYL